MNTLWALTLAGRLRIYATQSDLYDWRERLKRNGLTTILRLQLRDLLSPRVRLREPVLMLAGHGQDTIAAPTRVKDFVDWEIVLGTEHVHSALKDLAKDAPWQEALPELLSDASVLLRDALDLMRQLGGVEDRDDSS